MLEERQKGRNRCKRVKGKKIKRKQNKKNGAGIVLGDEAVEQDEKHDEEDEEGKVEAVKTEGKYEQEDRRRIGRRRRKRMSKRKGAR